MARTHGLASTYSQMPCRCDPCKAAWCVSVKRRQAARAARLAADPTLAPHGRASTYVNWSCRCPECKAAGAVMNAKRRNKREHLMEGVA